MQTDTRGMLGRQLNILNEYKSQDETKLVHWHGTPCRIQFSLSSTAQQAATRVGYVPDEQSTATQQHCYRQHIAEQNETQSIS